MAGKQQEGFARHARDGGQHIRLCAGLAQNGLGYPDAKTLTQFKSAVVEVLEDHDTDTYRAVYTARFADTIYVLHCFKKKSSRQSELPKRDRETIAARLKDVTAIEDAKRKGKGTSK